MIGEILKLAWWLFFVIFKFIWAPLTMATATDYIWWEILLVTVIGGWIGIFIFYYFGKVIMESINKRRKNPPKRFSQLNRFVVRVKRKYGLTGLVTIIGVISVPICTLIAAAYFKENKRVIPALMTSVLIWSCSLTAIVYLFIDI
ncbi:MAG: hypothetical protein JKY52_11315 [Flavobacteriales bacterium]|nr:hypothetical protein [Flavobacteriales bacterium]